MLWFIKMAQKRSKIVRLHDPCTDVQNLKFRPHSPFFLDICARILALPPKIWRKVQVSLAQMQQIFIIWTSVQDLCKNVDFHFSYYRELSGMESHRRQLQLHIEIITIIESASKVNKSASSDFYLVGFCLCGVDKNIQ